MEKREYSFEEIKAYCTDYKKQHVSDDMQHQLYVCLVLGIKEKHIEQLGDEKIPVEKRELLKEALLNDFPEEIYNSMLLSEDVSSCRQIRETYLMKKYAENNPALKKAEEQVEEFHRLLDQYKYRVESNEELAKAISVSQSAVEKAYEAQIKNLQDISAAVSEEKEKRLEEKDKTIAKLESQILQLEEKHKEEQAALRADMERLIAEKTQIIEKMEAQRLQSENNQSITAHNQQAEPKSPNSTESLKEEGKKKFLGKKSSKKNRHTKEEKKAMVEFIRTNGFNEEQNNFLIACFKKGVPFKRIQEIAGKNLNVEQMKNLLNFLNEGE